MYKEAIRSYLRARHYEALLPSHILFDMDGVLFDSMPYHAKAWHQAMKEFGLNLPEEEAFLHEGRTGKGTIDIVMQRQCGRHSTEQEVKEIYALKSRIFNSYPVAKAMPGARKLVQQMRQEGLTVQIVTGSGQKSLLGRVEENYPGLFAHELMVTAFDVKYGKPNPEPYLMGLQKAGIDPEHAIVVENAPLGVEAAHAAGIFCIAVNTGPLPPAALQEAGADLLFSSMPALAEAWPELYKTFGQIALPTRL